MSIGPSVSAPTAVPRVLIVGHTAPTHVGGLFQQAASAAGLASSILDLSAAYGGNPVLRRFNWWVRGRVPNRLHAFSRAVVEQCREEQPDVVITTGLAPVTRDALAEMRAMGARLCNFLTDDPWNPVHRAGWFFEALPLYNHVFSPRRANMEDLRQLGCPRVAYLPFAYDPAHHFPPALSAAEREEWASDIAFAGGADRDRVPILTRLIREGFNVSLWGGYWKRFRGTRTAARGHADPETMRRVIASTRVALGLVRRGNRDGHAMRTYEVAAIGAPMLVEDTPEHRDLFGPEKTRVCYFRTEAELVEKARWLIDHAAEGQEMAARVRDHIRSGANTYADRFCAILSTALSLT